MAPLSEAHLVIATVSDGSGDRCAGIRLCGISEEGSSAVVCRRKRSGTDDEARCRSAGPGGSGLSRSGGRDTTRMDEEVFQYFEFDGFKCDSVILVDTGLGVRPFPVAGFARREWFVDGGGNGSGV